VGDVRISSEFMSRDSSSHAISRFLESSITSPRRILRILLGLALRNFRPTLPHSSNLLLDCLEAEPAGIKERP
jgi:hypothetical protein